MGILRIVSLVPDKEMKIERKRKTETETEKKVTFLAFSIFLMVLRDFDFFFRFWA